MGIALTALLLGVGYAQLGGFRPIDLALVACTDLELVGVEFKGTPQDETLQDSFRKVEDIKMENPGAFLHTIYYEEPAGKRDTMHLFIGIQKASLRKPNPEMSEMQIPCRRAVLAKIAAHRFVMPSPVRIKERIKEFASSEGVILQEIYVDKLLDDSHVEVWAPVIDR